MDSEQNILVQRGLQERCAGNIRAKQTACTIAHLALCTRLFFYGQIRLLAGHKVQTTRSKLLGSYPTWQRANEDLGELLVLL
jgi:hypothetical protein